MDRVWTEYGWRLVGWSVTSSFISVVKGWANNENLPPLLCAWALNQKLECSLSKGVVCALGSGTRVKQVRHQGYNHEGHGPKRPCLTCLGPLWDPGMLTDDLCPEGFREW